MLRNRWLINYVYLDCKRISKLTISLFVNNVKDDRIYQYLYSAIFSMTTMFWPVAKISTNAVYLLVTQNLTFIYGNFVTQRLTGQPKKPCHCSVKMTLTDVSNMCDWQANDIDLLFRSNGAIEARYFSKLTRLVFSLPNGNQVLKPKQPNSLLLYKRIYNHTE